MRERVMAGLLAGGFVVAGGTAGAAEGARTERVSVGPGGVEARTLSGSYGPAVSGDGRFVAFRSDADNLVPGDTNENDDIFVRDRQTGTTERVNVGPGGVQDDRGASFGLSVSRDGRFVAFASLGSNLVGRPTYRFDDVFVRDRRTGRTELVSVGVGGAAADDDSRDPSISRGGRFVAFTSRATNLVPGGTVGGVFLRDRQTGQTERVGAGFRPAVSADGRFVAFLSYEEGIVPGDANGYLDVFVRDRRTGRTELVSLGPKGAQGLGGDSLHAAISAEGRYVAFLSFATNLIPGDTNGELDVFVRDRREGTTERVNVGPGGVEANGSVTDGPSISAGGRFVAFASFASNLVPGDTNGAFDIFVRDRAARTTERVNVGQGGAQASGRISGSPSISADARFVAFDSSADNLVPRDTNRATDVFVRVRPR